jgi:hypothetical protein
MNIVPQTNSGTNSYAPKLRPSLVISHGKKIIHLYTSTTSLITQRYLGLMILQENINQS